MLAHRLRRWLNIKPTLVQCLVFAGLSQHRFIASIRYIFKRVFVYSVQRHVVTEARE